MGHKLNEWDYLKSSSGKGRKLNDDELKVRTKNGR
jgi:hypothetical protein